MRLDTLCPDYFAQNTESLNILLLCLSPGFFYNLWVNKHLIVMFVAIGIYDKETNVPPDLSSSQTNALRLTHQLHHLFGSLANLFVNTR